jgi:EAL domain-containing protein (putative c-di-GMP-specific phosphodiesterase class I)/GGDEF domain-containing protein
MTLFNQINSFLFGLFLLVMCSLVYFQFTETKAFMVSQMESDLNNTSTSLGLMLKPHLETGDEAVVNTLVNVVFEGGFYQKVKLTWLSDKREEVWENPIVIDDVPQWFIDLDLFQATTQETVITSGWLQLATLQIESNPAIGYRELWRIMNDTAMVLSALFLLSILLMRIRLKKILKPLHEVSLHAQDIAQRKFSDDMPLPKTTELKNMVGAVNSMSGQLKQVFKTLDDEVNSLKHDKLLDHVSQLPNRLCLTGQLNGWLSQPGFGGLIIAKFDWLEEIHSQFGYQLRDQTIRILASEFEKSLPKNEDNIIARISNIEFAFLVSSAEQEQIHKYVQSIIRLLNQEMLKAGCEPNQGFALGVTERTDGISRPEFLSQADYALQNALSEDKLVSWFHIETEQEFSREQWYKRLTDAITNNQFLFKWQPVLNSDNNKIIHRELYCLLHIADKTVRAAQFMPYIERLVLGTQLDQCLLENIVNQEQLFLSDEPVAVNLTRESITDPMFHEWLANYLKSLINPEKLHFEMHEAGVKNNLELSVKLSNIIKNSGALFGVDNCGRQMGSLDYLQHIKPDFIKLDISLSTLDSDDQEENQQKLQVARALISIARGFNIKAIITGIEDEAHLDIIKGLRADAYQGYISPPVDV